MAQIKVKQIKSRINCPAVQKRTLDADCEAAAVVGTLVP